ncbi:CU044_5270 family protein [Nonomuraea harbinensis]|uniref:CU044_5270 family protein n=1 Tax=Nonomuraea harbinensis TaxID=1286938 RepID=A0ABW1C3V1_9ACTN|nr:CU044_5270 family protein [Nonomuraea harbinensis]
MTQLERMRSEIPRPDLADLRAQEERLLAAIVDPPSVRLERAGMRPRIEHRLRLSFAAGLAAAAASAGVVVFAVGSEPDAPPILHTMPVKVEMVLNQAAESVNMSPELHPKPGQFLVFESQTMDTVGGHSTFLARSKRKVWLPVEGDSTGGFIESEGLAPSPYPGRPIPPEAWENLGRSGPEKLSDFDHRVEYLRTDYAYLSRLPIEPAKMYQHLYTGLAHGAEADAEAWARVGNMLSEAYMPAAQRAALFRAAAAIPGVTTVGKAVDAAGRTGVAAARVNPWLGIREEYIFDRKTYQYLGVRSVVVDADQAKAPVGSVLTSSALLRISVVDQAPR